MVLMSYYSVIEAGSSFKHLEKQKRSTFGQLYQIIRFDKVPYILCSLHVLAPFAWTDLLICTTTLVLILLWVS